MLLTVKLLCFCHSVKRLPHQWVWAEESATLCRMTHSLSKATHRHIISPVIHFWQQRTRLVATIQLQRRNIWLHSVVCLKNLAMSNFTNNLSLPQLLHTSVSVKFERRCSWCYFESSPKMLLPFWVHVLLLSGGLSLKAKWSVQPAELQSTSSTGRASIIDSVPRT